CNSRPLTGTTEVAKYLALVSDEYETPLDPLVQRFQAHIHVHDPNWRVVLHDHGIRLLCSSQPSEVSVVHTGAGAAAILGTVFERNSDLRDDTPCRRATFDDAQS